jgi:uncharacterized protein involved in propanediol utilization
MPELRRCYPLKPCRHDIEKAPIAPGTQAWVCGHMGELMQGRLGALGPVALITLPCPPLRLQVRRIEGAFHLHASAAPPALRRPRAAALLRELNLRIGGRYVLHSDLPTGGGAGASTAALVALARAAAAAEGRALDPFTLARATVAVEGASDPLMFAQPERMLWASRRGRVLADLPALPRMEVLAGFHGRMLATNPRDENFPDVSDLLARWPAACQDAAAVAAIATQSAQRLLALRGPASDPCAALARRLGALGFAIGHTGPARALLFRPGGVPANAAEVLRLAGFRSVLHYGIGEWG